MENIDYLIRGGIVVNSNFEKQADVAIQGEKIVAVTEPNTIKNAKEIIDASGCYVLPGAIDTHTHFEEPFQGCVPNEDWGAGTRAACIGGTTFVFNFVIQSKNLSLTEDIANHKARASALSYIDFNFHGVFTNLKDMESNLKEIEGIIDGGVSSFKEFMIYTEEGLAVDDWNLMLIMKEITKRGGILGVHAENCSIGENLTKAIAASGKIDAKYWPLAKPNFVEAEAVNRAFMIAEYTNSNIYIVHTSTHEAVDLIGKYKYGNNFFLETCPHYLTFTKDKYLDEDGKYQVISPPLRDKEDLEELWKGLANGRVSFIGSDHNAYGKESKDPGYAESGFMGVANGQPGVFEIITVVYNEGVRKNRIDMSRLVEITSTNAAKIFGIFPKKGIIAPGSDADIVIFDPNKKETLGFKWYEQADTSFYEGMEVVGFPKMTIVKGTVVAKEGKIIQKEPNGKFVPSTVRANMYQGIS